MPKARKTISRKKAPKGLPTKCLVSFNRWFRTNVQIVQNFYSSLSLHILAIVLCIEELYVVKPTPPTPRSEFRLHVWSFVLDFDSTCQTTSNVGQNISHSLVNSPSVLKVSYIWYLLKYLNAGNTNVDLKREQIPMREDGIQSELQ